MVQESFYEIRNSYDCKIWHPEELSTGEKPWQLKDMMNSRRSSMRWYGSGAEKGSLTL